LVIKALASAGVSLGRNDLVEAAGVAANLILEHGLSADGHLVRTLTAGKPAGFGMLEDYAFLADGLLNLHSAIGEHRYLEYANSLAATIQDRFTHTDGPGFFDTRSDHETLIIRPRELQDGAIPCGNSVAIDVFLTLATLTDDDVMHSVATELLSSIAPAMAEHPTAFGRFLAVLERSLAEQRQLVLAGGDGASSQFKEAFFARYEPFVTLAYTVGDEDKAAWPSLGDRPLPEGASSAAFVCQGMACQPPVTDPGELVKLLEEKPNSSPD
jgi:uncharacterized protein YyaL (SSP411 family)